MGTLILNTWKSHANGLKNEDVVVPAGLGSTTGLWYGNNREYRDHSSVPLPVVLLVQSTFPTNHYSLITPGSFVVQSYVMVLNFLHRHYTIR